MPTAHYEATQSEYARHQHVSAAAVSKAIKAERLKKSIVWIKGIAYIRTIAAADREWAANTDLTRAAAREPRIRRAVASSTQNEFPDQVDADRLSVFVRLREVVLALSSHGVPNDRTLIVPMTKDVARLLGERLLEA